MVVFIDLLAGKWSLPILYRLMAAEGPMRFGSLQRSIGVVTQKELTRHLREFESLGLIERAVFPEVPPRVEYSLTPLGRSLREPLDGVAAWVKREAPALLAKRTECAKAAS